MLTMTANVPVASKVTPTGSLNIALVPVPSTDPLVKLPASLETKPEDTMIWRMRLFWLSDCSIDRIKAAWAECICIMNAEYHHTHYYCDICSGIQCDSRGKIKPCIRPKAIHRPRDRHLTSDRRNNARRNDDVSDDVIITVSLQYNVDNRVTGFTNTSSRSQNKIPFKKWKRTMTAKVPAASSAIPVGLKNREVAPMPSVDPVAKAEPARSVAMPEDIYMSRIRWLNWSAYVGR